MSDERTSPTPTPSPCPVCAGGFTSTPGACCPACGRSSGASPAPPPERDFRLRPERRRLDGLGWVVLGAVLLCIILLNSIFAPGVLILLAILLVPALVRTAHLARSRQGDPGFKYLVAFLAALGVSALTGLATWAACFAVCVATFFLGESRMGDQNALNLAFIAGGITAIVVFIWLSITLWPRAAPSPRYDTGED